MKTLIKLSYAIMICMLMSSVTYAGNQVGTVIYVITRASDGLIYFTLSGTKNGSPACAQISYWMIRNENSDAGKRQYAMLLSAKVNGKKIGVSGFNTCTRWGDGEDVNDLQLLD